MTELEQRGERDRPRRYRLGKGLTFRIVALALAAAGTLVPTILMAQPASASPCYGANCTGRDPQATGCADDPNTTTKLFHDYTAENGTAFRLEIRFSPSCHAAWGRLTVWSGSNVGFALSAWNPGQPSQGAIGHSAPFTWTGMLDASPPDCAGVQFYVNGQWVRWYYLGCW